jgi:hypothetical protein
MTSLYAQWRTIDDLNIKEPNVDHGKGHLLPLYDSLLPIQVFGTMKASKLAEKIFTDLFTDAERGIVEDAMGLLLNQIRRDLSIKDTRRKIW